MEHLDKLSLGIRWAKMGEDKDYPSAAFPATTDNMASMSNAPKILFDVVHQTLVHFGPAVRWEQDPTLSESVIWDLPPGAPLHTMLPTSALRQCIL